MVNSTDTHFNIRMVVRVNVSLYRKVSCEVLWRRYKTLNTIPDNIAGGDENTIGTININEHTPVQDLRFIESIRFLLYNLHRTEQRDTNPVQPGNSSIYSRDAEESQVPKTRYLVGINTIQKQIPMNILLMEGYDIDLLLIHLGVIDV